MSHQHHYHHPHFAEVMSSSLKDTGAERQNGAEPEKGNCRACLHRCLIDKADSWIQQGWGLARCVSSGPAVTITIDMGSKKSKDRKG